MTMNRLEALNLVRSRQADLQELGVRSLKLFGSVARDQATKDSDVDILVELDESIGFFEFFQIKIYLQKLLQRPVDLGTSDSLKEHLRKLVFEDLVHVF